METKNVHPVEWIDQAQDISFQSQTAKAVDEIIEWKKEFQGEDTEVSVLRSSGVMEGGWVVKGIVDKNGEIEVLNRFTGAHKTVKAENLKEWQPFKKGEVVPILFGNVDWNTKEQLVSDAYQIVFIGGNGMYMLDRIQDAQRGTAVIASKSLLCKSKIAEFDKRIDGIIFYHDTTSEDRKVIAELNQKKKYWQDKLTAISILHEEREKK